MADFLSVSVLGDRNLIRNLEQMPDTVRAILVEKTRQLTEKMANIVRTNIDSRMTRSAKIKGEGGVGAIRMRDAVETSITVDPNRIEGSVYISDALVPYARIQERGGVIPPHIIRPREGKVMVFIASSGDKVFATRVFHPGAVIAPNWFMKDAYREMGPEISKEIKKAVVEGIRKNMRSGL